jgi:hypothetical protein
MNLAATQWRAGFNGVYGLDYTAIITIAQALHIATDRTFFEKLKVFEKAVLEQICEKQKSETCDPVKCKFEYGEYFEWACENCRDNVWLKKTK